jgi:molybdopterin-synthase adenylyltransferase
MTEVRGDLERYSRQIRFAPIGVAGQERMLNSRVAICGCGALGTTLADLLTRAGVGWLRIIDRDVVELSNLQRQVLFDEQDVQRQSAKAAAAADKLQSINSQVTIEPVVADLTPANALVLLQDVDLILDATDNFETRYLINDVSLTLGTPWIYAGCVGSLGQSMTIIPGETACLQCVLAAPPPPDGTATCDTAGVIAPAIQAIVAMQATSAMKWLTGHRADIAPVLTMIDVWEGRWQTIHLEGLRERGDCPACGRGERKWLSGAGTSQSVVLCGRNAVQISPAEPLALDLERVAQRWQPLGEVTRNPFLVRLIASDDPTRQITAFRDGRAIVHGTSDPALARAWYARYLGG